MSLTYSSMLELGSKIPDFKLINALDGDLCSSESLHNEKPTLIMVICNHCPSVIHYHEEIQRLERDFGSQLDIVSISSNDVSRYPQDGPKAMKELFNTLGLSFPYLFDETQEVAKALKAECTPEFYLYDNSNALVYRGRLDASSPGKDIPITGADLRAAVDALVDGSIVPSEQHPSMGCSIKWK